MGANHLLGAEEQEGRVLLCLERKAKQRACQEENNEIKIKAGETSSLHKHTVHQVDISCKF